MRETRGEPPGVEPDIREGTVAPAIRSACVPPIPWISSGSSTVSATRKRHVERLVRVLVDHLDVPAQGAPLPPKFRDLGAVDSDRPGPGLGTIPMMACRVVVFPQPDWPTRATNSPSSTRRLTPSTADGSGRACADAAPARVEVRRSATSRRGGAAAHPVPSDILACRDGRGRASPRTASGCTDVGRR